EQCDLAVGAPRERGGDGKSELSEPRRLLWLLDVGLATEAQRVEHAKARAPALDHDEQHREPEEPADERGRAAQEAERRLARRRAAEARRHGGHERHEDPEKQRAAAGGAEMTPRPS